MKYCKKCGGIMKINKVEEKYFAKCCCGAEEEIFEEIWCEEIIKKNEVKGGGVGSENNILATFPHECKKCGFDKAQVIEMGVWYSDEAGVIRYKCGRCGYTEQDKGSNT